MHRCIDDLDVFLTEGQLTEQMLLDRMHDLLDCARQCNAALRWRLLHRRATHAKWRSVIMVKAGSSGDADSLMTLLLKASQQAPGPTVKGNVPRDRARWTRS